MASAATTRQALPHWDVSVVFPDLVSPEFNQGFREVVQGIHALQAEYDRRGVAKPPMGTLPITDDLVADFDTIVRQSNEIMERSQTLRSYIHSYVATDSRNNLAQARLSEFQQHSIVLAQLGRRLTAWLGAMDIEELIRRSPVAQAHAFMLRKASVEARHQMSPPEEELAVQLDLSSGIAWGKLHGNMTSQLTVPVELEGRVQELPMSAIRNLAYDPNREMRRRAYEAELAAWARVSVPLAAALNSIKGEVNTLSRRRGWESALDETVFDSNIDRETLDAMRQAAFESFPVFRRYLRAKARALRVERLAWYDLFAPVGQSTRVWEWEEATAFIVRQFGTYSQKMSDLAARAFRERWVDAEPRAGKRDGAFCMLLRQDESRVLSNFKPAFGGMSTLAHELGHAYHNLVKAGRTPLQKTTPMTLAETASIFCETIVRNAALQDADRQEQLAILEASLQGHCQVVVDIMSRFLFENRVFEARQARELSVDEFNELMLRAEVETYGDGLDPDRLHPYMWAVKSHYYSAGLSYYNFPYMFGLLFGLGLYARYRHNPDVFRGGYDELLSSTGMADAATLAARFGIDTRSPDFWRASLAMIREEIERFEELVG